MNAMDTYVQNTNWAQLNEAIERTNSTAIESWFAGFRVVVISDKVLTADEIEGVKDFYITVNFSFKIPLKARDKAHAGELFDDMSFEPECVLDSGATIYGDYDTSSVHLGSLG